MSLSPSDLIRKAAAHLNEVGLKKGAFSNAFRSSFPHDKEPVCGVGALKWAATGSPHWIVNRSFNGHREFIIAWGAMNKAAVEEDPSIPLGPDSFMEYTDDDDTTKEDVLTLMEKAAVLAAKEV